MKHLLTFFLLICFHLPGEQARVVTTNDQCPINFSSVHLTKTNTVERTHTYESSSFGNPRIADGEDDLSLFIEDDDEENYNRKGRLPVECFPAFLYSLVIAPHKPFTDTFLSGTQCSYNSSCKFIFQRALRI